MASIKKRGKRWYIKFSKMRDGETQERTLSLGTNWKQIAEKKKEELEKLEDAGEIDPYHPGFDIDRCLNPESERALTIREAIDAWLKTKEKLSVTTYKTYKSRIYTFMNETGSANRLVKYIDESMIEKFIFREATSRASAKSDAKHLSVFLNWVVQKGWLDRNPIKEMHIPAGKSKDYHQVMLQEQEFKDILSKFDTYKEKYMKKKMAREFHRQEWFKPMLACFFYGGFRLHEIAHSYELDYSGLKLYQLEKKTGSIWIPRGKGKKGRLVPISKHLQPFLADYLDLRKPEKLDDFIFAHLSGPYEGSPVSGTAFRSAFDFYCKEAEVPESRIPHGLRHNRVTSWIKDGFTVKEASMMAGHSSTAVTEGLYTHLVFDEIADKMKRLESEE